MYNVFAFSSSSSWLRPGWVLAAAVLTGCASVSAPPQTPSTPNVTVASPAAAESGLQAGTPASQWWKAFGDQQLDTLVKEAMASNLDLRAQLAGVKAARALVVERSFDGLPSGGIQAGYGSRKLSGPDLDPSGTSDFRAPIQRLANADFVATWEIDLFGRVGTARGIGERGVDLAVADQHAAMALLQAEVVLRYVSLRAWQQQVLLLGTEEQTATELDRLIGQSIQRGLTDVREAAAASNRLAELRTLLVQAKVQARTEVAALAVLIGRSPLQIDQDVLLSGLAQAKAIPVTPDLRTVIAPAELLRRRPDVQRAEAVLRATLGQKVLADRAFLPSLGLNLSAGLNQSLGRLDFDNAQRFSFGGLLQWNPLDFGRFKARAEAMSAESERAHAQFEQTVLRALEDAEARLRGWQFARLAEYQAQRTERAIAQQHSVTVARVVAGLDGRAADLGSALEASRALRSVQQAAAQHAAAFAQVQLALMAWQPTPREAD